MSLQTRLDALIVAIGADIKALQAGSGSDLSTDYVDSTPAAPASGLTLFTRFRARRLLAMQGPEGLDSQLQPAFFSNRVCRLTANVNSSAPSQDGLTFQGIGTTSGVPMTTTNFYTMMARSRWATSAVASQYVNVRNIINQWFMSSTPNLGGFFAVFRFGLNAVTVTNRLFVGMSVTANDLGLGVNQPSALLNMFGFGCDSGDTNIQFMHNDGSGAATKIDLGANFPAKTAATYFYEFRIFVPSGAGQKVFWSAHRLNDGIVLQGGPITTNLPAINTLMNWHLAYGNGSTAAAVSLDVQSVYMETDN